MRANLERLSAVMTASPVVVPHDAPLDEADALFAEHGFRHLAVVRDDEVVGVLSERDVCLALNLIGGTLVGPGRSRRSVRVEEVMRNPVRYGRLDESTVAAARRMLANRIGCLPVFDAGRLVGIVTETDLLRAFVALVRGRAGASDGIVRDIASGVPLLAPTLTVERALDAMDPSVRHVLVGSELDIEGIASERDLFRGLARSMHRDEEAELAGRPDYPPVLLADVMTSPIVTIGPGATLSHAAEVLLERRFGALPVVGDDGLVGIVVQTDLIAHFAAVL